MENGALRAVAPGIWVAEQSLRFMGLETGTRMTVVRLGDGRLFVHSPIAPNEGLLAAVRDLGPVAALVAPSRFHHLYVEAWSREHPEARLFACPTLDAKRPDLPWHAVLGDTPEPEWAGTLEQVLFGARSLEFEVVFFHPATRTMICCDAIFNLGQHPSPLTRVVARMIGNGKPGATWLERIMLIRDRAAAREQVDRMLAWDADRILLAHGALVETGGREVLRRAYAWL